MSDSSVYTVTMLGLGGGSKSSVFLLLGLGVQGGDAPSSGNASTLLLLLNG